MRTGMIVFIGLACAACASKNAANRPDSTAPAAATVVASAASPSSTAELRHYIDTAQSRYIAAAIKGDVATIGGFYTNDASVFAPNAKAAIGRGEIDKANTEMFAALKVASLKLATSDLETSGDFGVETGTYEQTLQPKTGKAIHDVGKYLLVWKKQAEGSWKIFREIYNSDLPAKM
jgi:ketosteroid isomerase-like protein